MESLIDPLLKSTRRAAAVACVTWLAIGLLGGTGVHAQDSANGSGPINAKPMQWIGYTEGRNDRPEGQFANWVTQRSRMVRADGSESQSIGDALIDRPNTWTQFAGWSPDGKTAILGKHWESPENAAWERAAKTFRMTEGWLSDCCLYDLNTNALTNLTEVERVSIYNSGLFYLPNNKGFGFTPLIGGISKPFVMELSGKNKRDVSGEGQGFAYGYSASPDGTRISYHQDYQIYVADLDGGNKVHIQTGNPFNFAPAWSPDGQWLLFVSGEHYNCHPTIVKRDGTGLRKLADRGGYRGVVEKLKHPDFHSESSDVPVWDRTGKFVFYTALVDGAVELIRVDLEGNARRLTTSRPGTRHYHPAASPHGDWILFGSDRDGSMQIYVSPYDGSDPWPVSHAAENYAAMHGIWQK